MFSQHPKALFWSDRNFVKPNEVALNSHKKFWFDCECGHAFDIQLNNVIKSYVNQIKIVKFVLINVLLL
jgi:hypothetical protein